LNVIWCPDRVTIWMICAIPNKGRRWQSKNKK
jgi:hypothetical protein